VGYENRDYSRESDYTGAAAGWGFEYISPVVKWLIVANVAVFLLQILVTRPFTKEDRQAQIDRLPKQLREMYERQRAIQERAKEKSAAEKGAAEQDRTGDDAADDLPPYDELLDEDYILGLQRVSIVQEWLELDTQKVMRGQVWRLLTHAFCHERTGVWHILLNMLALFWFGVTLESMYGQREFLLFYLASALVAGAAHVALGLFTGQSAPAIGASGAVMAVLMLYAIHYPRNTIRVFWFFPIEVRWLVILYVIYDLHPLLLELSGSPSYSGVGHAAHLGGMAFGFLYWKFNLNLERYWNRLPQWNAAGGPARNTIRPLPRKSVEQKLEAEVDEILSKISISGEESLTEAERRTLELASRRYKNKQR
jgi:membrane associated rhomboid family serine protease